MLSAQGTFAAGAAQQPYAGFRRIRTHVGDGWGGSGLGGFGEGGAGGTGGGLGGVGGLGEGGGTGGEPWGGGTGGLGLLTWEMQGGQSDIISYLRQAQTTAGLSFMLHVIV